MARKRPMVDLAPKRVEPKKSDLDSLFSEHNEERYRIQSVSVDAIEADPSQPRTVFDDSTLDNLAESIKLDGLIQPIEVVQIGRNRYQIVHGERRWRASKSAGLDTIPAMVRRNDYDEVTKFVRQMVENIQREDLNDVDRAAGLVRLKEMMAVEVEAGDDKKTWQKTTWTDVAKRMGYTRQRVNQLTKLLKLPTEIQQSIMEGALSERDTRIFHGMTNRQQRALHRARVIDGTLSQAETRRVADYIKRGETDSVSDAIQAVQGGTDRQVKSDPERRHAANSRNMKQLHKSLDSLEVGKGDSAENQSLLADLESARINLDRLISQVKSQLK